MVERGNLLAGIPGELAREHLEVILRGGDCRLERIVSTGHVTPPGQWYDQERDEWVLLVAGRARLLVAGAQEPLILGPGDWVLLPAHLRHRVEWTDPGQPTVWLALHFAAVAELA